VSAIFIMFTGIFMSCYEDSSHIKFDHCFTYKFSCASNLFHNARVVARIPNMKSRAKYSLYHCTKEDE